MAAPKWMASSGFDGGLRPATSPPDGRTHLNVKQAMLRLADTSSKPRRVDQPLAIRNFEASCLLTSKSVHRSFPTWSVIPPNHHDHDCPANHPSHQSSQL
ncbi:hypothetical protein VDGL01_04729 [Verticillium dahliae]